MITLKAVEIVGVSDRGAFSGGLKFGPGLNILSAPNAYGKSLAVTAIPWCLGLEPMFGLSNNDPSRFPAAVRDVFEVAQGDEAHVVSSEARLTLQRDDGATVTLVRSIKSGTPEFVDVFEHNADGSQRVSRLLARRDTMADESAGLQRFLYAWIGMPRAPVMTTKGNPAELYLENLAPLFFIDQTEGWSDLQALQVFRYQLQEVSEVAVEYLLGAQKALAGRFERQQQVSLEARLKGAALNISERVAEFTHRQGWTVAWSAHGRPDEISKRWAAKSLSALLRAEVNLDLKAERQRLGARISALRASLADSPKGEGDMSPASEASQAVVDLKNRRHERRSELREARIQLGDQESLLVTLEHRRHSSEDVLRLKTEGIGRLDLVECPTCHRELEASTFQLSQQSAEAVRAHIDALHRQRTLIQANIASLKAEVTRLQHAVAETDEQLLSAERTMATVNSVKGAARERLAKIALDLSNAERGSDRLAQLSDELERLEREIQGWIADANAWSETQREESDLPARVSRFVDNLRAQLLALGHSAVREITAPLLRLDEGYVPYLAARRLRSLGSASDHPRLVAAYVLALAETSRIGAGHHPGFVVLDEPQQQNPDDAHMDLLLRFFEKAWPTTNSQVVVTTYLRPPEVDRLTKAGVAVTLLEGDHLLALVPPDPPTVEGAAPSGTAGAAAVAGQNAASASTQARSGT